MGTPISEVPPVAPPQRLPNEVPPPSEEEWSDEDYLNDEGLTASEAEQRMLLGETRGRRGKPRRNRRERVLLLVAMAVAMVGAAYAVWKLVVPKFVAEGVILFDHLGNLPTDQQKAFEQRQLALLNNADTRQAAQCRILQKDSPTVSAGFLTDPTDGPTLEPSSLKIDSGNKQGALRLA